MKNAKHAKHSRVVLALAGGGAMMALYSGGPVMAQEASIEQLRAQMQEMQRQIERLESQQAEERQQAAEARESLASSVVTAGDTQGSFKLPGSDTSVQIGGYIKFDAIYDLDQDLGDSLFVEGLDTGEQSSKASFRAHARQSRLFVKTSTPTAMGPATTHLEGDFFGGGGNEVFSNSRGFRLRHAYGEWNGILAGQTWSNFMHFTAYPSTVDFDGPVGVSFIRQAQLRYTLPLGGDAALSFSAENPEATGFEGSRDTAPDFTARYQWTGDAAGLEAAGLVRRLKVDDGDTNDSATGYGLMLAGNIGVGPSTTLMAGAIYGDGIGRYLYTASGSSAGDEGIGEAFVDNGTLETIEAYGFNAAVSHDWTDKFTSGLSYGQVRGDRPGNLFPESTRKLESIHFSHFYQVTEPVTLGFEVSHARKELQNGEDADNTRLQLSAQYNF